MTCSDLCSVSEIAKPERTTEGVAKGTCRWVVERSIRNDSGDRAKPAFLCNEALTLGPYTRPLVPPPFADIPFVSNPHCFMGEGLSIGGFTGETGLRRQTFASRSGGQTERRFHRSRVGGLRLAELSDSSRVFHSTIEEALEV